MFSKLKTLLVNEWFMNSNMSELACLLEHTPLVEKITLLLSTVHIFLIDALYNCNYFSVCSSNKFTSYRNLIILWKLKIVTSH